MKTDKGFEIDFFNLSYRRKFIRILWTAPFIMIIALMYSLESKSIMIIGGVLILVFVVILIQAIYLYKKWKNGEDENDIE